ncbi:splicing factor 45-like [Strongylocentrotus purpuratus]|uniref:Splicing factor 45 n=1 Tax=Strongylocentrotus purpuratus TaxID=7668 RepID=A0A7M7T4K8_STRPU|nr:splicing factor 45-like [Strongylocentrotus purpuratus]XP_030853423.1 splicing factor 45-like [Strongylocentrotus purpuratus]
MSLYDGLGVDTGPSKKDSSAGDKKGDVSGWSAGIKMMQSHLRMKKAALTEAQRKMKQPSGRPVLDPKKVPAPGLGSSTAPASSSRSSGDVSGRDVGGRDIGGRDVGERDVGGRDIGGRDVGGSSGLLDDHPRFRPSNLPPPSRPSSSSSPRLAPYLPSSSLGSDGENEYDPAYPNEYEKVAKKLREKRERERDEQDKREREERRRRREKDRERDREKDRDRDRERRDRDRDRERDREREPQGFSRRPVMEDDEDDRDRERRRNTAQRAAIAPPSSLINEDSQSKDDGFAAPLPPARDRPYADMKRKNHDHDDLEGAKTPPRISEFAPPQEQNTFVKPPTPKANFQVPVGLGVDSVAMKIMAKYGFKEGAGLGKSEQGISTALQVEKTSRRGGKIINKDKEIQEQVVMPPPPMPPPAFPPPAFPPAAPKTGPAPITDVLRNPTKILLLTNMVGPGEVDDDLQPETAEECSKYGEVVKVLIYEDPLKVATEAVRIFVEFTRVEAAVKAVVDLNGRFFGGRIVKGSFYDPQKFGKFELTA